MIDKWYPTPGTTTIRIIPENLIQIEGHPEIYKEVLQYCDATMVIVLNMSNRMHYTIIKNDHCSILLDAQYFGEPKTMEELIENTKIKFFDDQIEGTNGETLCAELDYTVSGIEHTGLHGPADLAFDNLKKHTDDKEIIEVLEKIINE